METPNLLKGTRRSKAERYRAFAEAYLNVADPDTYLNVYKSAIKVGYRDSYARTGASRLLDNVRVKAEIERIKLEKIGNPNIATPDEVLEALTTQMRVLPNQLFHPETKESLLPADMNDRQAQALAGYEVKRRVIPGEGEDGDPSVEVTYKFKLVDRQKAAVELGRYWGLFEKDNKQQAPTAPQAMVAFPTGPMTLDEWQRQAEVILARQAAEKFSRL
jgi:hypothetical protein